MPNRVSIPNPEGTLESHQATLMALKEAIEILMGQRGSPNDAAVIFADLLQNGTLKQDQVPDNVGSYRLRR